MSSTTSFHRAHNPLRILPSVLAMPDLQRRLSRVLRELPVGEEEVVALMKLDPLAVLRGLRSANTVVFRQANALPTVRGIVRSLGPTLSKRLFRPPATEVISSESLQQLWRHAIATALAAQDLAERTGLLEPEVAYLMGLLHDLPEWLRRLNQLDPDPASNGFNPNDCILNWQLPAPFVSLLLAIDMGDPQTSKEHPADPAGLIRAAELLAELAGYGHPSEDGGNAAGTAKLGIDPSELQLSQKLARKVNASLRSFGFAPDITEHEIRADQALPLPSNTQGTIDEVVISILSCTRSESYRGIITALTAASVRYGDYDRAFFAKWHNESRAVTLRSKADSSARRMVHTRLQASEAEAELLRNAHETQRPVHLHGSTETSSALLRMLSTDELLAVPLNCDFETPAFLLLDRSITLTPIDDGQDMTMATMLGMMGSLLIDNLLLRRRSERAQKFALTDPLTRLFNRRMGIHALEQSIARTDRDLRPLTLLMCDLDHFKKLNDALGHVSGDAALRATADVLRYSVRKTDTVCRYGGEEFLVVLPDTTPDEATVLATRMFTAVQARGEELGLPITISIGLTSFRAADTVESMLIRADHALYASKGYGRNRFSADIEFDDEDSLAGVDNKATAKITDPTTQPGPPKATGDGNPGDPVNPHGS